MFLLQCVDLLNMGLTHTEDEDERLGIDIVLTSLYSPIEQILQNADWIQKKSSKNFTLSGEINLKDMMHQSMNMLI